MVERAGRALLPGQPPAPPRHTSRFPWAGLPRLTGTPVPGWHSVRYSGCKVVWTSKMLFLKGICLPECRHRNILYLWILHWAEYSTHFQNTAVNFYWKVTTHLKYRFKLLQSKAVEENFQNFWNRNLKWNLLFWRKKNKKQRVWSLDLKTFFQPSFKVNIMILIFFISRFPNVEKKFCSFGIRSQSLWTQAQYLRQGGQECGARAAR